MKASNSKFVHRLLEHLLYFQREYGLPIISLGVYPFPTTVVESLLQEMNGKETFLALHPVARDEVSVHHAIVMDLL